MAIAYATKTQSDGTSTGGASVNSASIALTTGDLLVVRLSLHAGGGQTSGMTGITWNGNALTMRAELDGYGFTGAIYTGIWTYQVASGTSAVVTMDPAGTEDQGVVWEIGVITGHDTGATFTDTDSADAADGTATLTLTTNVGDLVLDSVSIKDIGPGNFDEGAGQTVDFEFAPGFYQMHGASRKVASGASTNMQWTQTAAQPWVYAAIAVKEAAGVTIDYVLSPPQGPRLIRPRMIGY